MIERTTCPFCNKYVQKYIYNKKNPECQYAINGKGAYKTKQYFHKTCFEWGKKNGL